MPARTQASASAVCPSASAHDTRITPPRSAVWISRGWLCSEFAVYQGKSSGKVSSTAASISGAETMRETPRRSSRASSHAKTPNCIPCAAQSTSAKRTHRAVGKPEKVLSIPTIQ